MRYRMILPIAALLAALVAVPAAQAKVKVGLSEQNPAMFDQPSWQQLKLKRVRYIVSWDYAKQPFEHAEVTGFMNAARAHKQEVLVTFNAHRGCFANNKYRKTKACKAPSAKAYKAAVKGFRKQFPYAKMFAPWNEVNHVSQPTYKKPKLAARYYKAMKSVCKKCTVMAADVLDSSDVKTLPAQVPEGHEEQGPHLGPAQLQGRQPPPEQGRAQRRGRHEGPDLAHRDGRVRAVQGVGLPLLAEARRRADEVHVLAREEEQARQADLRLPLVRRAAQRALRRRPGRPERRVAPGLKQFRKSIKGLPR